MNARPFAPRFFVPILAVLVISLSGCATPRQGPVLPEANIGVVEFTQPQTTADMLAGYMAESTPRISSKTLMELNEVTEEVLRKETKRTYATIDSYLECREAKAPGQGAGRVAALKRWVAVGNCMKVDFLIVPQVMELQEREGGEAGVTRPAGVTMNVYLVDVKNAALAGRSHYDEIQAPLTANLLNTPKFFSRGGKWVSARDLIKEGFEKAVKDLGL